MTAVATSSHALLPHPGDKRHEQMQVTVECRRIANNKLALCYRLSGALALLRLPASKPQPERRDGLWQHSCFEAFIRIADATDYMEYNFSPSRDWAHYRFVSYRSVAQYPDSSSPCIEVHNDANEFSLRTAIAVPAGAQLQIGLSTVLEDQTGNLSYWALHHPSDRPDFHHPDAFTLHFE